MMKNREVLFVVVTVSWKISPALSQDQRGIARMQIDPNRQYQVIQGLGMNYKGPYFRNVVYEWQLGLFG
jgi:hypothetical protein